jgi:NitT/TauT family transport system permease protein
LELRWDRGTPIVQDHLEKSGMDTRLILDAARRVPLGLSRAALLPNGHDLIAFAIIIGSFVALVHGAHEMRAPLSQLDSEAVRLDPSLLPDYALRTTLRMFAAMAASVLFTFAVATLAAKNRKAELLIIPTLDILQSVPVLGFLTFTVMFFLRLFPGSQLGAECAAIFAIFTAQAWNMTFSFYQSLRTLPRELDEVARHFRLSPWLRFWRLEVPFATPALVWNAMLSMSGSWFFVVASEAISVGHTKIALPGIGAWLALAVEQKDLRAIALAVAAIATAILLYDQFVFRPLVVWADKFRFEQTAAAQGPPRSWIYDLLRRTRLLRRLTLPLGWMGARLASIRIPRHLPPHLAKTLAAVPITERHLDLLWLTVLFAGTVSAIWLVAEYARATLGFGDLVQAVALGGLTLLRVAVLIALASLIWVPIGIWIGLRPAIAERVQPLAHRRRERVSDGSARDLRHVPRETLAMVAQGHPARDLAVFRDWGAHCLRRRLECQRRGRGSELGRHEAPGGGPRSIHRRGNGGG